MINNKRLQGNIVKARNSHISYELRKASSSFLPLLLDILTKELSASSPENEEVYVSSINGDIELRGIKLGYGFDDVSGVYLLSLCEAGDDLVKALASELNSRLKKENFSEHIRM